MKALYSLFFVFALLLVVLFGVGAAHLNMLFGVWIPYVAMAVFLLGFIYRVYDWAKSPVPFRIPTTGGQQWSVLPEVKQNRWDNPTTVRDTVIRMAFEVLLFRSLFRNTKSEVYKNENGGPVVAYASAKWLWLFGILFHYSFLTIVIRHMRLFTEPVPGFITLIDSLDSLLQIAAPTLYLTDVALVAAATFLLMRRILAPQIRYLSLAADYFPLFLILAIAISGIYMRYIAKVDVIAIKELTMGLVTFHPHIPANVGISFYIHLFLVSILLLYFPFSKLMHLGGVFLSPTRNLPNDSRVRHHENPWNPKIKCHSYADYEDDFREPMIEAGLPVDKAE